MSKKITVMAGTVGVSFNVSHDDYNQYINETMPNNKVNPAFNLLSRTVDADSRKDFEQVALQDSKPKGLIVMQMAGVLAEEFGGDVAISLKKSSGSQPE